MKSHFIKPEGKLNLRVKIITLCCTLQVQTEQHRQTNLRTDGWQLPNLLSPYFTKDTLSININRNFYPGGGTLIDGSTHTLGRLGCHFGKFQCHKG